MIQAVSDMYATQAVSQSSSVARSQASQAVSGSGDTVDISDAAKSVSGFFQGLGVDYAPGNAVSLDDLELGLQKAEEQFRMDVDELFVQHGIRTDPPVNLTTDSEGAVIVQGDHPQKKKIERLFEDNPDLANDFRRISSLSSLVKAVKEHMEFAREYEENPYAAVAKYSYLFDGGLSEPFVMTIGEDEEAEA